MQLSLSVILLLRNREPAVTRMVRRAVDVVRSVGAKGRPFELLAVDQTSVDNTLSLLSVLHARLPELRILQDVRQGMAVIEAARAARGERWLLVDRLVDPQLMTWGLNQLENGKRAAIVPGEILAVEAKLGAQVLGNLTGGLVSAQQAVEHELAARGQRPAWSPAPDRGVAERAALFLRQRLGWVGLSQLDRPLGT
ncbi:hypothetical protein [Nannocystis punicea]|uniref:Glycosyl transferase family 2 n=1 Tax=Nannocystis punicea TaxID=2995304 RepID=A0ABY7H413_9BACT|nr:hypothetical protein [Nannocystis poenicansa]WAS93842.1 hypothetical protein O0S08_47520 [Nannocystis poenicansa]